MYKIHEVETNVTYDDSYTTIEEAEEIIKEYEADDGNERQVTYEIVEIL